MLPNNPAPLHWHILRSACRINSSGSEERTIIQLFLRSILGDGPCFDPPATVLLAVGLVHFSPACRALALEVLLAAVPTGRLRPGALGTALGQLLAGEFGPVQRLTVGLAQARAINPTTDDALHQVLNSLLVELPSSPPRSTTKLLDAYANLRNSQPLPDAVRARLTGWQTVGSLKKPATMLLRDGQPATDA